MAHVLGIDIGGTGIKAAPVDLSTGTLLADRVKIDTPRPALPPAVAAVVRELVMSFTWTGRAGITFPGVVTDGVTRTAANVDKSWIDFDARDLFEKATGLDVTVINDADAAGLAEMKFGAGVGQKDLVPTAEDDRPRDVDPPQPLGCCGGGHVRSSTTTLER